MPIAGFQSPGGTVGRTHPEHLEISESRCRTQTSRNHDNLLICIRLWGGLHHPIRIEWEALLY